MGTIDNDGIGIGDINTVLDDGGREQHIVVIVGEVEDNLFQFLWFHLSVTYCNTGIGHILLYYLGYVFKIGNAIVDKVNLTITRHLKVDGIGDDLSSEGMDFRLDGIAVGGRCLNDTEIAGAHE